jgi:PAS domain S-box-containing protein
LSQEKLSADWYATVIDGNKAIIAATHDNDQLLSKPAAPILAAGSHDGRKVIFRGVLHAGTDAYITLNRSELSGWTVGVALPLVSLDFPVRRSIMTLVFGGIILVLVGTLSASAYGRRIARSINTLSNSAVALGRSEIEKIPASSIDEVNEVGRALEKAGVALKRAEEARSRLAAIVESSDDAIIGKTLEGTILSWNMGAEKIYGYSSQEITGQPISLLIPPAQSHELPLIVEKLRNGEHIEHFETQRVRKDGKEIDVSLTVSPIIDSTGNITGASSIARDITERKRAEDDLRRQKEMLQ